MSGIEERRYAAPEETVAGMAVAAAQQCLERAGMSAADIGFLIVSSGSAERRFPGPAPTVAHQLGLSNIPAIDLPMASAGGLFGMVLAQSLAQVHGNVLVVAAEKMSAVACRAPMEPGIAILFGDGAGACIISPGDGPAKIVDAVLHSDGAFAEDLRLEFEAPLSMNGRSVIMQASRKIPGAIAEVLQRNSKTAGFNRDFSDAPSESESDRSRSAHAASGAAEVLFEYSTLRKHVVGFNVNRRFRMVARRQPASRRANLLRRFWRRLSLGRIINRGLDPVARAPGLPRRESSRRLP